MPNKALELVHWHIRGVLAFDAVAESFGLIPANEMHNAPSTLLQINSATIIKDVPFTPEIVNINSIPLQSAPNIRQSKWLQGTDTHIRLQEFIKGESNKDKFDKVAMLNTKDYHWSDKHYDDKDLIAYEITGNIFVDEHNEQLRLNIPIGNNYPMRIMIRPDDEHAYEWKKARDVLGIGKENEGNLQVGQTMELPPNVFVVLKMVNDKNDHHKQYKNFYNLYFVPEDES